MVASSSNLMIPQVSSTDTSTTTNDFTSENINQGFLIASNSMNNISGDNTKDSIMLPTSVSSPPAHAAAAAAAATTTKPRQRASARIRRPRRQKMASIGVEAMRMMTTNDSNDDNTSDNINSNSKSTMNSSSKRIGNSITILRSAYCTPLPLTPTTTTPTSIIATALPLCRGEVEKASASASALPSTSQPQKEDDITPPINLNLAFSSLLSVSNNNCHNSQQQQQQQDDHGDDDDIDDEWGTFVSFAEEEDDGHDTYDDSCSLSPNTVFRHPTVLFSSTRKR